MSSFLCFSVCIMLRLPADSAYLCARLDDDLVCLFQAIFVADESLFVAGRLWPAWLLVGVVSVNCILLFHWTVRLCSQSLNGSGQAHSWSILSQDCCLFREVCEDW